MVLVSLKLKLRERKHYKYIFFQLFLEVQLEDDILVLNVFPIGNLDEHKYKQVDWGGGQMLVGKYLKSSTRVKYFEN